MSDMRRHAIYQGGGAALLLFMALMTATVFTGPSASAEANGVASIAALALFAAAFACTSLLARTIYRHLSSMFSKKVERSIEALAAEHRRTEEGLLARFDDERSATAHANRSSQGQLLEAAARAERAIAELKAAEVERAETTADLAAESAEHAKAAGSLARSLKLQTESMTLIRKQTRAILEQLSAQGAEFITAAAEGRDTSRKVLNLVRSGRRYSDDQLESLASKLRDVERQSKDLEVGQRRAMNYLRKDANIQEVLGKLIAAERRLTASIEASALTSAGSVAEATSASTAAIREDLASLRGEIGRLDDRTGSISTSLDVAVPRTARLAADLQRLLGDLSSFRDQSVASASEAQAVIGRIDGRIEELRSALDDDVHSKLKHLLEALQGLPDQLRESRTESSSDEALVAGHSRRLEESIAEVQRRLDALLHQIGTTKSDVKSIGPRIDRNGIEVVKQVEAMIQLLGRVDTSAHSYPSTGGWAMAPDSLLMLSDLVREKRPRRIVELGSGASTVWLGTFAKEVGATLHSFEHLEEYRRSTAQSVAAFELDATVDLRLAELAEINVDGETRRWYDPQAFADLVDIDMLIVDGPPKSVGTEPRLPAFQQLRERLAPGALIVVDDLHRGPENAMVETWMKQDPQLSWTPRATGRTGVLELKGPHGRI